MNILTLRHPAILQYCYELDALTIEEAVTAIIEPAKIQSDVFKTFPFEYDDSAVEKILESVINIQDGKIEAASLQIVCRYIEENLVQQKENVVVTKEDIGDITNIFQQYYESVLIKFTDEEKENVQRLIEDELIDGDKRNTLTGYYIRKRFGIAQSVLDVLEESSLLKKERDASGRHMYEIGHDTIVAAVNRVAERRREGILKRENEKRDERQRALEYSLLREQNTAKKLKRDLWRVQIMVCCTILMIIIGAWSFISWRRSVTIVDNATTQTHIAVSDLNTFKMKHALGVAKRLKQVGDSYLRNKTAKDASKKALGSYQTALDSIKAYKADPFYIKLKQKIDSLTADSVRVSQGLTK